MQFLKQHKKVLLFIAKAFGLLLIWLFGYELWLKQDGRVDQWLTTLAASHSSYMFSLLGWKIQHQLTQFGEAMLIDGEVLLYIAHSCNGLILYSLFAGFILVFGSGWKKKLYFVVLGLSVIYALNILRIMALSYIQFTHPEYLDISHKYIFTLLVYGVVFFFWVKWVQLQTSPGHAVPKVTSISDAKITA